MFVRVIYLNTYHPTILSELAVMCSLCVQQINTECSPPVLQMGPVNRSVAVSGPQHWSLLPRCASPFPSTEGALRFAKESGYFEAPAGQLKASAQAEFAVFSNTRQKLFQLASV